MVKKLNENIKGGEDDDINPGDEGRVGGGDESSIDHAYSNKENMVSLTQNSVTAIPVDMASLFVHA